MIQIDHAALYVTDLERIREFYERWFGATANDQYHNPRTGLRTYFLTLGGTVRIELMSRPDVAGARGEGRLGWAHLALNVGSRAAVDDLAARMRAAGVPVVNGPRVTGDGYYEAVVLDPEGNEIELVG